MYTSYLLLLSVPSLMSPITDRRPPNYPYYIERSDDNGKRIYSTDNCEDWQLKLAELHELGWPEVTWQGCWYLEGYYEPLPKEMEGREITAGISIRGWLKWLLRRPKLVLPDNIIT